MPPSTIQTFSLQPEDTNLFMDKVAEASAIMSLSERLRANGNGRGKTIHNFNDVEAKFQMAKGDEKETSKYTDTPYQLDYYPLYIIVEIDKRDAKDGKLLYDRLVTKSAAAIGRSFDKIIFSGTGVPPTNFDKLSTAATVQIPTPNTRPGFIEALTKISEGDYELNGWILSNVAKGLMAGTVDANGNPIYTSYDNLLGSRVLYRGKTFATGTIGFAGDWTQAVFSDIEGVQFTQTSEGLTLLKRNAIAFRVEAEVGFRISNIAAFRKLIPKTA